MPACSRPPLERALDANQVALGERWAEQVFTGDGQGLGVFRLTGSAGQRQPRAWSVTFKALPDQGGAPMTAWTLAMREPPAWEGLGVRPAGDPSVRAAGR
jgi:hypothetical protein